MKNITKKILLILGIAALSAISFGTANSKKAPARQKQQSSSKKKVKKPASKTAAKTKTEKKTSERATSSK